MRPIIAVRLLFLISVYSQFCFGQVFQVPRFAFEENVLRSATSPNADAVSREQVEILDWYLQVSFDALLRNPKLQATWVSTAALAKFARQMTYTIGTIPDAKAQPAAALYFVRLLLDSDEHSRSEPRPPPRKRLGLSVSDLYLELGAQLKNRYESPGAPEIFKRSVEQFVLETLGMKLYEAHWVVRQGVIDGAVLFGEVAILPSGEISPWRLGEISTWQLAKFEAFEKWFSSMAFFPIPILREHSPMRVGELLEGEDALRSPMSRDNLSLGAVMPANLVEKIRQYHFDASRDFRFAALVYRLFVGSRAMSQLNSSYSFNWLAYPQYSESWKRVDVAMAANERSAEYKLLSGILEFKPIFKYLADVSTVERDLFDRNQAQAKRLAGAHIAYATVAAVQLPTRAGNRCSELGSHLSHGL